MNHHKLTRLFPNASPSFIKSNSDSPEGYGKPAKLEQDPGNEPLATPQAQEGHTGKVIISYTSVTARLLDPDNPASKYHTDSLRYAGLICGDSFKEVEIKTTQRKCKKGEPPHTIIEITYP